MQAGGFIARRLQGNLSQVAGGLDVGGIVEREQGMQGGVGAVDLDRTDLTGGVVEHLGRADNAAPKSVERAPVESVAFVLGVFFIAKGGFFPNAFGLVGVDRPAAGLVYQQARDSQCLVAQHGGWKAVARPPGQQAIFRIFFKQFWCDSRCLAVGGAGDDGTDQPFDIPTAVAEIDSKIIEKFGHWGPLALDAEIFGRFYQAHAEKLGPQAVDGDTGSERVFCSHEPAGQGQAINRSPRRQGRQGRGRGGIHFVCWLVIEAGFQQESVAEFGLVGHHHHAGDDALVGIAGGLEFFVFVESWTVLLGKLFESFANCQRFGRRAVSELLFEGLAGFGCWIDLGCEFFFKRINCGLDTF